jgi:hypothetical protein
MGSIRLPVSERPYFTPGFPLQLPLQHGIRIETLEEKPALPAAGQAVNPIVSDTGQLNWDCTGKGTGLVRVDSPRTQILVGFLKGDVKSPANFSAQVENRFCALVLISLDGQPISRSGKLLLSAAAHTANQEMRWNEKRNSLLDWGNSPVLIEPVVGKVRLKGLGHFHRLQVAPLNSIGQPLEKPLPVKYSEGRGEFAVGKTVSLWYVISIER